MGFMDKVKAQAEMAMQKAQQTTARLDQQGAKKQSDALLHDLGAAYYAQQRMGGPEYAVTSALTALDAHASQHGPIDVTAATTGASFTASAQPTAGAPPDADLVPDGSMSAAGAPPPTAATAQPASTPASGNFSLDDL